VKSRAMGAGVLCAIALSTPAEALNSAPVNDPSTTVRGHAAAARQDIREAGLKAVAVPPVLQSIAACESGGNPSAIGGGGLYRGKYQFDFGTWASVGGSGDPAAASEAEQDMRAAVLYARAGSTPWPVCG
jgi:hypothetical protein